MKSTPRTSTTVAFPLALRRALERDKELAARRARRLATWSFLLQRDPVVVVLGLALLAAVLWLTR